MTEPKKQPTTADDWRRRYETGDTPWDSGLVSRELRHVVESGEVAPCRAIELGCGTGTNAVYLAERGFQVTAVDLAANALEAADAKARAADVAIELVCGDATRLDAVAGPFEFLFDRGCYHCVRRAGSTAGYLATVERLTRPGAALLVLIGNPNDTSDAGIPKVSAAELCADFERLGRIVRLAEFHFEDVGGAQGPLGWSLLLKRK